MSLIDLIREILTTMPITRDSDERLTVEVWRHKLDEHYLPSEINKIPLAEFFAIYTDESILPSTESIRRTRQLLQQKDLLLRGHSYQDRQAKSELVRQELGEWS